MVEGRAVFGSRISNFGLGKGGKTANHRSRLAGRKLQVFVRLAGRSERQLKFVSCHILHLAGPEPLDPSGGIPTPPMLQDRGRLFSLCSYLV
jgi:hypothetical protein